MTAREALAARFASTSTHEPTGDTLAIDGVKPAPVLHRAPDRDSLQADLLKSMQATEDLRSRIAEVDASKPYTPVASPGSGTKFLQVQAGDTLASIASKLDMQADMLFKSNSAVIEAAAREHGHSGGSDGGSILIDGTWLEYRPFASVTRDNSATSTWF